jgi:hypothetical protein
MRRRLGDLKRQADRALLAHQRGEWWDGRRWRRKDEAPEPRRPKESAEAYAERVERWIRERVVSMERAQWSADVLPELFDKMLGSGDADSPERLAAAQRFERGAQADREQRSASTGAEAEAEMIFAKVTELLGSSEMPPRPPWTRLAMDLNHKFGLELTPNQLRMICRRRPAK